MNRRHVVAGLWFVVAGVSALLIEIGRGGRLAATALYVTGWVLLFWSLAVVRPKDDHRIMLRLRELVVIGALDPTSERAVLAFTWPIERDERRDQRRDAHWAAVEDGNASLVARILHPIRHGWHRATGWWYEPLDRRFLLDDVRVVPLHPTSAGD